MPPTHLNRLNVPYPLWSPLSIDLQKAFAPDYGSTTNDGGRWRVILASLDGGIHFFLLISLLVCARQRRDVWTLNHGTHSPPSQTHQGNFSPEQTVRRHDETANHNTFAGHNLLHPFRRLSCAFATRSPSFLPSPFLSVWYLQGLRTGGLNLSFDHFLFLPFSRRRSALSSRALDVLSRCPS